MTGNKYQSVKSLTTTEIAKLIRKDIKKEHPEIKTSVRTQYFAGGSSIDIYIMQTPFNPINPDFNFDDIFQNDHWTSQYIEEYIELEKDIEAIHARYNYNNSDTQVDYFDVNYYGSVNLDYDLKDKFIAELKEKKEIMNTEIMEQAELIITETPEDNTPTEIERVQKQVDDAKTGMNELVEKMTSLLDTNRSLINALTPDIKIAHKYQDTAITETLENGHKIVWDFANQYTDLEGQIRSLNSQIKDGEEYIQMLTEKPEAATSSDSKFDVKLIVIERAEGLHELCVTRTFKTFDDANDWLLGNSETYPKNGSYDKHDFTVIFTNGQTYEGRLDCQHASMPDPDLSVNHHMIDHLNWLAGRTQNPYCGKEKYQEIMVENEAEGYKQQAEEWLDNYNL